MHTSKNKWPQFIDGASLRWFRLQWAVHHCLWLAWVLLLGHRHRRYTPQSCKLPAPAPKTFSFCLSNNPTAHPRVWLDCPLFFHRCSKEKGGRAHSIYCTTIGWTRTLWLVRMRADVTPMLIMQRSHAQRWINQDNINLSMWDLLSVIIFSFMSENLKRDTWQL